MDVYDGYNERLSRVLATIPNPGHPRDARPKIDVEGLFPRKSTVNIVWWSAERFAGLDRPLGVAPVNFTAAVCLR